jgi:hypothetical protein
MKKPLIPEQWNNPPEIPDQRLTVRESVGEFVHMVIS